MPGFVKLLTAADIPPGGRNNFFSPKVVSIPEEVSTCTMMVSSTNILSIAHNVTVLLGIS